MATTVRFGFDLDDETTVFSKPVEVEDLTITFDPPVDPEVILQALEEGK